MGQTTRSQGISFTHDMWDRIEARHKQLKVGRSSYFQMLVERDLRFLPEAFAHKADGRWHFYPEPGADDRDRPVLRAAEDAPAPGPRRRRP